MHCGENLPGRRKNKSRDFEVGLEKVRCWRRWERTWGKAGRQRAGVLIPWKPQRGLFSRQVDKAGSFAFYAGQVPLAAVLGGVEGTATEQGKTVKTSSNS